MLRTYLGTIVYDWPRLLKSLGAADRWINMRNRIDRLTVNPGGIGVKCEWEYTRSLHLCNVFPMTGNILLRKALRQWPINPVFERDTPENDPTDGARNDCEASNPPNVSFIIGHRGLERLSHLLMTLSTIRGQENAECECIVIEQDKKPLIREHLPDWVCYRHVPAPGETEGYNRSAALNAGAAMARGTLLILHDHDLLVPSRYAAQAWRLYEAGYEVIQLKRFIFYLHRASTDQVFEKGFASRHASVERVIENMQAGASLAVSAAAYEQIGGMDEDFVGWGGEDNEFWDRCLTRKVWEYGYLPFVHLWHASLAERRKDLNPSLCLLEQKRSVSMEQRIQSLRQRQPALKPIRPKQL